jgi:hypothetical protein
LANGAAGIATAVPVKLEKWTDKWKEGWRKSDKYNEECLKWSFYSLLEMTIEGIESQLRARSTSQWWHLVFRRHSKLERQGQSRLLAGRSGSKKLVQEVKAAVK